MDHLHDYQHHYECGRPSDQCVLSIRCRDPQWHRDDALTGKGTEKGRFHHLLRNPGYPVPAGGRFLVYPHRLGDWRCDLRFPGHGPERNHHEVHDRGLRPVQRHFCLQRHLPHQVPPERLCGSHGEEQYCPGIHRRDAEYHLRPHAGGHRCGRLGRWTDWRRDWAEGFEEALYKGRARFSQITRHSPSAVNQTSAGKRAA